MKKPEPWPFNVPLPSAMTPGQLIRVLQIGWTQYYKFRDAGLLRRFEVTQPIGHAQYSGALVDRWRRGEAIAAFGAGHRKLRRPA